MIATDENRKYSAPALEKGLDILELLARHGAPRTKSQIANELDRSLGELFRMVDALVHRGYLAPAESGDGFELTNKLFELGLTRAPTRTLLEEALPVMRSLAAEIHQSCHLAVASNTHMVVIARIESPGNQGYSVRVGYRRTLVESTSGLVLFAFQPERVRAEWKKRLAATVAAREWKVFEERAEHARRQQHVRADSDVTKHILDLSAPVLSWNGVAAALTCPYIETPSALPVKDSIVAIRRHAEEISRRLSSDEAAAMPAAASAGTRKTRRR